jgi:hypothetical protein
MPDEPTGCASCKNCNCEKTEGNQRLTEKNRLINGQNPKNRPLNRIEKRRIYRRELMSRPKMTKPEIDARVRELQGQAAGLIRRENNLKIVAAFEKILAVYEGRIRWEYDPILSQTIACLDFALQTAKECQA